MYTYLLKKKIHSSSPKTLLPPKSLIYMASGLGSSARVSSSKLGLGTNEAPLMRFLGDSNSNSVPLDLKDVNERDKSSALHLPHPQPPYNAGIDIG